MAWTRSWARSSPDVPLCSAWNRSGRRVPPLTRVARAAQGAYHGLAPLARVLVWHRSAAMAQRAWEGRRMRAEGGRPERRAPARGEGRRQSGRGADRADDDRAAPSRRTSPAVQTLHDVLTAALRQRVARDPRSPPLWAISASTAWMRQRSWCSRHRGVARWGSVGRVTRSRWQATRRPRPAERRMVLDRQRTEQGGAGCRGGSRPSVVCQMQGAPTVWLHCSMLLHGAAQARGTRPCAALSCHLVCLHGTRRYPLRHRAS